MKGEIDYTPLSMFIILGTVLFITYYFCYKTFGNPASGKINYWTNNGKNIIKQNKNYIKAYTGMIGLATIAGIYLMYYLSFEMPNKTIYNSTYDKYKKFIYIGILLLVGFSIMWVPSILAKESNITNICLFIASVGAMILLASVIGVKNKNSKDNAAIAMAAILVFQTFVLDFLIWTNLIGIA